MNDTYTNESNINITVNEQQKPAKSFWHKVSHILSIAGLVILLLPCIIIALLPILGTLAVGIAITPILILSIAPILFLIYIGGRALVRHLTKKLEARKQSFQNENIQ